MKKTLQGMAIGFLIGTMSIGTVAYAKSATENITVRYDNIKMVVDGVPLQSTTSGGATVEPFIYNGTTYLPVRAVSNAIGKQVTWDGATKTVYIGNIPKQEQYLMKVCPPYSTDYGYYSANGDVIDGTNVFSMAGKNYTNGFKVGFCSEEVGSEIFFNLNGKYERLEFDLGAVDDHMYLPLMLKIYLDGNLEEIIEMDATELPKHITVDLNNALQMRIEAVSKDGHGMWGSEFGIANAIVF